MSKPLSETLEAVEIHPDRTSGEIASYIKVAPVELFTLLREAAAIVRAWEGAAKAHVIGTTIFDDFLRYELHTEDMADCGGMHVRLVPDNTPAPGGLEG